MRRDHDTVDRRMIFLVLHWVFLVAAMVTSTAFAATADKPAAALASATVWFTVLSIRFWSIAHGGR
jgi:membrane protein YdbS with pleckstrin-like domain